MKSKVQKTGEWAFEYQFWALLATTLFLTLLEYIHLPNVFGVAIFDSVLLRVGMMLVLWNFLLSKEDANK